jgi:hypothetical protein
MNRMRNSVYPARELYVLTARDPVPGPRPTPGPLASSQASAVAASGSLAWGARNLIGHSVLAVNGSGRSRALARVRPCRVRFGHQEPA